MKKITVAILILITAATCFTGCRKVRTSYTPPKVEEGEKTYDINPAFTEESDPENWGVQWQIIRNGEVTSSYRRDVDISFGGASTSYKFEGVPTFRGNNYRSDAAYGTADITTKTLTKIWENPIGGIGEWTGCGWSGQPLIVRWEEETKQIMNLYPEKKEKKDLVEVIYATLDGNIYFYDLEDGSKTRDTMKVGMTFKGTGTLDPRGYPIMYIGSGIASGGKDQRMYGINLIDCTVAFEKSGNDRDAQRYWPAFDSSPIIDAKTDTLIWPGENGVLYTLKLNTDYNPQAPSININPEEVVKARYKTSKTATGSRWTGFESSCVIVDRYLYISENSGMFFCVDLTTMELLWAQDVLDDSNSTPVFEWDENGKGYIYTAPSLRWTAQGGKGSVSIFKLDAETGEIIWEIPFECGTIPDTSGGVQSSPVLGRKGTDLEGVVIYNVAFTPSCFTGKMVAIDTKTGEIIWEHHMPNYTWSSPVAVYTNEGKSYVIVCDSIGDVKLLEGTTGEFIDSVNILSNVEASPAVFENTLVVGTRGSLICGIKIE